MLSLALVLLSGCGGSGGELPNVNDNELRPLGNPGGTGETIYTPAVVVPELETYLDQAPPSADTAQRWVSNSYSTLPQGDSAYQNASLAAWAEDIFNRINAQRADFGVAPLIREPHLDRIAQAHARDMALRDYFDHNTPEGLAPWERLGAIEPPAYNHTGESNAHGQESTAEVISGWMGSAGHRDILLNPAFTHIGVGVYYDPSDLDKPIHVATDLVEFLFQPVAASSWGRQD